MSHYHKEDAMLELDYPDSIYDVRLFLTDDGRKRGLWIWLEEDNKARIEADSRFFHEGLDDFMKELKKLDPKDKMYKLQIMSALRLHFDMFFGHRTEAAALRLSWKQVKKLAAALNKGHKAEKKKTENW